MDVEKGIACLHLPPAASCSILDRMKATFRILLSSLVLALALVGCSGSDDGTPGQTTVIDPNRTPDGIRIHGAVAGEWTHDWDAAIALAREEKRPVLAIFTASDWNVWHRFVAQRIFNTPVWKEWIGKRLVLAWINHPNDERLVPAEYVERNRTLTRQYDTTAFPALLLINAATRQAYDRYHVTRDSTPEGFISWINRTVSENQPGGVKAALNDEDRAALEELRARRRPLMEAYNAAVAEAQKEYDDMRARTVATADLVEWTRQSDAKLAEVKAPLDAVDRELDVYYAKSADSLLLPAP